MQSLTLTNMIRAGAENDFGDSYKLEQLVSANFGWKVVYEANGKYLIEDIIAYAFIRNDSYWEFIPLTPQELHSPRSLPNYVLNDGYVGLINPENELVEVEDIEHLNLQAVKEALRKNRVKLD